MGMGMGMPMLLPAWPCILRTGIRPLCGLWWGDRARREEPIRANCRGTGLDDQMALHKPLALLFPGL